MNQQKTIIFYGAGLQVRKKLDEWKASGLTPACFADVDPGKQHKKFLAADGESTEHEVLPLSEAIKRYPNYELYLTVGQKNLMSVADDLLLYGIPHDRIHSAEDADFHGRLCALSDPLYHSTLEDGMLRIRITIKCNAKCKFCYDSSVSYEASRARSPKKKCCLTTASRYMSK